MGKSEILSYPLLNILFKDFNIPVYRNDRMKSAKSLIQARKKLQDGWSIVIFPEGGIPDVDWPKMVPFKIGAFKLAKACNVPIIPITFLNHYQLFSEPETLFASAKIGISKIKIHPVISVAEQNKMTEKELSDFAFELIKKPLSL